MSSRIPFSFVVGAAIVFFLFLFNALQFFGREFILIALQDGFFFLDGAIFIGSRNRSRRCW